MSEVGHMNNSTVASDDTSDTLSDDEDNVILTSIRDQIQKDISREGSDDWILESKSVPTNDGNGDKIDDDFDKLEPKLKKAILKMRRLDRILAEKEKYEKEVKRNRILFHKRLLEELKILNNSGRRISNDEKSNTEKYLALELPISHNEGIEMEEVDENVNAISPLFETQPSEPELSRSCPDIHSFSKSQERVLSPTNSLKSVELSDIGDSVKMSKNSNLTTAAEQDFISRNIKLAADAGNPVAMTDDEKNRIKQLLNDIDEDTDNENSLQLCAVEAGEGFIPGNDDSDRLSRIDNQLKELLPPVDYDRLCVIKAETDDQEPLFTRVKDSSLSLYTARVGDEILKTVHNERLLKEKLNNVESRLKEFYNNTPYEQEKLSEERLSSLLDECSRCLSHCLPITENSLPSLDGFESNRSNYSHRSLLSEETLNKLLEEAREEINRGGQRRICTLDSFDDDVSDDITSPMLLERNSDNAHGSEELYIENCSPVDLTVPENADRSSFILPDIQINPSLIGHSNVQSFCSRNKTPTNSSDVKMSSDKEANNVDTTTATLT